MKVALVHDWLTGMRGGERVLEHIARSYPDAPIHTLVWKRGTVSSQIESHPIHTSFIQHLPAAIERYRWFLPLFPAAIERFDLTGYDVVISTSHCVAKSVRTGPDTFHLSYVFTPMRYIWELELEYFPPGKFPWPLQGLVRRTCARLRKWDVATSSRAHTMVADSAHVAARIRRHYRREVGVVHPPVDVHRFTPATGARDYYLVAGAFAPYKRVDLAIEACRRLGRRLVVSGTGQEDRTLRRAVGDGVEFVGWVTDDGIGALYAGARALLFPGEEDFGIVPVEAMASGCPVIAYGRGGALETVGRGASAAVLERVAAGGHARAPGGVLFGIQSVEGLAGAIRYFEEHAFDPIALRHHVEPFKPERFDAELGVALERGLDEWRRRSGEVSAGAAPRG